MAILSSLPPVIRVPLAGIVTWLAPGLGHILIGDRVRGLILMITITLTFWTGVAVGGVCDTVDPANQKIAFMGQSCAGGHMIIAWAWGASLGRGVDAPHYTRAHWLSAETGVVYAGIAGLLNILVILDVLARADAEPAPQGGRDSKKRTAAQPGVPPS